MNKNYNTITELPNTLVTEDQVRRAHQRYVFASKFLSGGTVIEVGCGGGQGLGILADVCDNVVGIDIDEQNVNICNKNYIDNKKVKIMKNSADDLDFDKNSLSAIILFETIYYLENPEKFIQKAYNMLNDNGFLIICSANKDWPSFNPSPFSNKYFSVSELDKIVSSNGFEVEMFGSFPDNSSFIISLIKKLAVKFRLMPKTMKGKVLLKKIFMGKMVKYPNIIDSNLFEYEKPLEIPVDKKDEFNTAIFCVGKKIK